MKHIVHCLHRVYERKKDNIKRKEKKKKHDQLQNQNAYNNKFFFRKW